MRRVRPGSRNAFERTYSLIVAIKGFDGFVEVLLGLLLIVTPSVVQAALAAVAAELGEGASPARAAAAQGIEAASDGIGSGTLLLAVFLLVHGIVKLATVYCLLRRIVRAYPWAILVLTVLLGVQLTDDVLQPGLVGWALAVLDVIVIVLVSLEYQRLRHRAGDSGT